MGQTRVSFRRLAKLAAFPFLMGAVLGQCRAQENFYMQVSTSHGVIAGESKDAAHPGWIELRRLRYEAGEGKGTESGMSESHAASPDASKSPRDVASGQASGKRQYKPLKAANKTQTSAETNSAEVATQSSSSAGGSASSHGSFGRHASEVVVTKITDKSSPQLLKAATSGEHLPQVVIEICKDGACRERLRLKDVLISSYKTAPHAADVVPTENVTLQAARIEREAPRSDVNAPK